MFLNCGEWGFSVLCFGFWFAERKIEKDNKTYYNDSLGNLVYPIRFGSIIL